VTGYPWSHDQVLTAADLNAAIAGVPATTASTVNNWLVAQRNPVTALTDAATITPDFSAANNFSVTLGGSRTLANPSNIAAGQAGQIVITQDGTGSRTLTYGSVWKFPAGITPVLSTAAGAVDILSYYVWNTSHIAVSAGLNFS